MIRVVHHLGFSVDSVYVICNSTLLGSSNFYCIEFILYLLSLPCLCILKLNE